MTQSQNQNQVKFQVASEYKPLELYCIQDKKTGKFMPPFFCINQEDAIRQVKQIVNYSPSLINTFPQDYALYFCGMFDEFHGVINASNSVLDGFIAYLDEYKTDDTIAYDNLKKDIVSEKMFVQSALKELEKRSDELNKTLAELNSIKSKYEESLKKTLKVDDVCKTKKKSLVDKLFGF